MQKILEIIAKQLSGFFKINHVAIFQLGPSGLLLNLIYCSGFSQESIQSLKKLMAEQKLFKRLVETRIPQVVNDILETESSLSSLAEDQGLNSMIAVPIFADQKPWGILAAFGQEKFRFSEKDGKIASLFAGQTGQLFELFSQYVRDNLDELLVQILGSIELMNLRYGNKDTVPVSEILNAQKRLKSRIQTYMARLEQTSTEGIDIEARTKEEAGFPSGDELSIEEVITIQGEKNKPLSRMKKVLVIDDQPIVTDLLVSVLERMNYQAVVASCGIDGVKTFEKDRFDLVITDLGMPDISGWEVSKAVKQKRPDVPVVVITGWGVTPDPHKMKDSKVDFVINKPFQLDQLEKIVRDLLEK
jgi:CheY-like chemotaxis protein